MPKTGAANIAQYGYLLPDHWILRPGIFKIMHDAYVARVVEIVKHSRARTVLEAGCGDGWNCGQLAAAGLDVVGCDWSPNAIEHARRMVPGARFYCGDVTDAEFLRAVPDPFDAVVFVEVIEHIAPDACAAAVRNLVARLKPGGVFVLTTPSTNFRNNNSQHYRHFTEPLIRQVLDEAGGLRVEAVEGYGHVPLERRHWKIRRFFDNRVWTIHLACRVLMDQYARRCSRTTLDVCHGLIVTARKIA